MNVPFFVVNGDNHRVVELIPSRGDAVPFSASTADEVQRFRDFLAECEAAQSYALHGTLLERVHQVVANYQYTASNALAGSSSVRDDMLVFLRAVAVVVQSVTDDHISHAEAKARLRGLLAVIERSVSSLREERFTFRESAWRRDRDLFHWDGPERNLREQLDRARSEVKELKEQLLAAKSDRAEPSEDPSPQG